MFGQTALSFQWLVYWSWQRRGIRHRWYLKGQTMVSAFHIERGKVKGSERGIVGIGKERGERWYLKGQTMVSSCST